MMRRLGSIAVAAALAALPAAAAPDAKALYNSKCGICHGQDGVPKKTAAGSKAFGDPEFKKAATVDSIVKATHEGVGKMKPVKSVSADDAKAIAEYILAMGPKS